MFDTHSAVKTLKETGFTEEQAVAVVKVIVEAISQGPATKTDIAEVKNAITALRTEIMRATVR
jgi:hypothetical protein